MVTLPLLLLFYRHLRARVTSPELGGVLHDREGLQNGNFNFGTVTCYRLGGVILEVVTSKFRP